jgi:outer membrane protein assembly factor BamB
MRLPDLFCVVVTFAVSLTLPSCTRAEAWPNLRGPKQGHSDAKGVPIEWSETTNVKWKTELPGEGWSSPVTDGKQVWMTTATEEGRSLRALCCDFKTGKLLMDIEVFSNEVVPPKHKRNSYASPTPILDGNRVYIDFGPMGVACLSTKDGKKLWENRELQCDLQNGPGGSLVLYNGKLLAACDGMDVQYGAALDAKTGKLLWKVERSGKEKIAKKPADMRKAYGTPVVFTIDGRPTALTCGAERLYAQDPATGAELWYVDYPGFSNVPTPVFDGKQIYVCTGFGKPELWAIKTGDLKGDVTETHVVWKQKKGAPDQATPIVVGDRLYMVTSGGIASCINTKTGEVVWEERIGADFAASPLCIDGKLYFFDAVLKQKVIAPSDTFTVLGKSELPAGCMATPAVFGKSLIVRTKAALYRIEAM